MGGTLSGTRLLSGTCNDFQEKIHGIMYAVIINTNTKDRFDINHKCTLILMYNKFLLFRNLSIGSESKMLNFNIHKS